MPVQFLLHWNFDEKNWLLYFFFFLQVISCVKRNANQLSGKSKHLYWATFIHDVVFSHICVKKYVIHRNFDLKSWFVYYSLIFQCVQILKIYFALKTQGANKEFPKHFTLCVCGHSVLVPSNYWLFLLFSEEDVAYKHQERFVSLLKNKE